MGRLNDGLIRGITVAAVALLALLPGAHAAKPQRRLKVGTVINGEQMATNSKDFRTTLHSRRLQDTTAIRSSIAFYITELAADLDAAGIDHTTVSANAGGMPDGPTTDFITAKRPLKLAFFNRLDSSRSATQQAYIMEKLLPATGAMLARSMRVRTPSGPLVFDGIPDEEGVFLPAPTGGIDADVLLKVTSNPADSEECAAVVASASPLMHEYITARPIYGVIRLCRVDENNFYYDLTTIVHEILHALGFIGVMFPVFPGYPGGTGGPADFSTSRTIIKTPNVLTSVRQQFACPSLEGAPFEDDGGSGTAGAHWEERIFQGEMLDAGDSGSVLHHNRHVLTDVSLALLQDTNWYDVKYGSAGFNSFGYKAGCEFVTGTYEGAMQDTAAARYLCSPQDAASKICLHDHSGDGSCLNAEAWDGFWHMYQFEEDADCQGTGEGQRCLVQSSATGFSASGCVEMRCSASGAVLVDGEPCDASSMDCPDEELMCGDPGLLTCIGSTLSDCSGNGDCLNGRCFCHSGWGGEDCSKSICVVSCPNGDPCPASGFCGVPECGEWSEGSDDRGVACNGSTTPETANPSPPAPIGSPAPAGSLAAVPPGGSAVGAAAGAAAAAVVFAAWLW